MKLCLALMVIGVSLIFGCGVNKVIVSQTAEGPKDIFINLQGDPLLISIELKTSLESRGYHITLNTEEAGKMFVKDIDGGSIIYKNASDSPFRYELVLGYQPIQDRIQLIAASLRDRQQNKILGTYRWSWDRLLPAPTIEGAIDQIDKNLLSKVFR